MSEADFYPFPEFGMYRALDPDSAAEIGWFAEIARDALVDYFDAQGVLLDVQPPQAFGTTFVCRRMVRTHAPLLRADGFDFAYFRGEVERALLPYERDGERVRLASVQIGRKSLGLYFQNDHPGFDRLVGQKCAIRQAADRAGGEALCARTGSHVTILKWGRLPNGQRKILDPEGRTEVRMLIGAAAQQCALGEIGLCRMVTGLGYLEPWTRPIPRPPLETSQRDFSRL
jgi:hypothetical protein